MSPAAKARAWWHIETPFSKVAIPILVAAVIGLGGWLVSLDRAKTEFGVRLEAMPGIASRLDSIEGKIDRMVEVVSAQGQRLARIEGMQRMGDDR